MCRRRPTRACPHFGNGSTPAPSHSLISLSALSLAPHSLEQQQRQRLSSSTTALFAAVFRRSHRTARRFLTPRAPPPHAPRYQPARHANRRKVRPNRVFLQRRRRHRAPWPPASLSRRSSGRATLTIACASSSGVWGYRSGHRRSRRRRFLLVNGAPLLCLAGAWGRLTAGSHVSVLTVRVGLGAQHRVHLAFCFGSVYSTGCA